MAGSLTWRPSRVDSRDGSWYVRVPWKDAASVRRWDSASIKASDHGGKRAAKVVAEKRAHELADARRDQTEDPATLAQLTVADLARRWLRATTTDRTADAQRNVEQYGRDYIVRTIGRVKLADVAAQHIGQVHQATAVGVSGRPLADVTRRHVHTTMVAMFGWAVRHRLIDRAPTDQTRPPKVSFTRRQVIPAADQLAVVQAVEAMSPDGPVWMMACAVRLALAAGVRRGELVGLRWGDWDPGVQVLTVARSVLRDGTIHEGGKSERLRRVVLADGMAAWLENWRERLDGLAIDLGLESRGPDDVILTWPTQRGPVAWRKPFRPAEVGEWWAANRAEVAERSGVPVVASVTWHGLRHSAVTALIEAGVSIHDVGAVVGHSAVATTMGYWRDGGAGARRVADASPLG